ncbi:hypothetical protein LguiB_033077 [Lonicera macranthoides]
MNLVVLMLHDIDHFPPLAKKNPRAALGFFFGFFSLSFGVLLLSIRSVMVRMKKSVRLDLESSIGIGSGDFCAMATVFFKFNFEFDILTCVDSVTKVMSKKALEDVEYANMTLIMKSLKNLRNAVCKTVIMTFVGIFNGYGDYITLLQLLLKSSQNKGLVYEATERALIAKITWLAPILLLPKCQQPYLKNKNPRIQANALMRFSCSVPRLIDTPEIHPKNKLTGNRIKFFIWKGLCFLLL